MAKVVAACTAAAQCLSAAAAPVAPDAAAGPTAAVGVAAFGPAAAIIAIAIYLVALMLQSRVEEEAPRSFCCWPASAFQSSTATDSEAEEGEPQQPTPTAGPATATQETIVFYETVGFKSCQESSPDPPARGAASVESGTLD